jgi:hypothetical protein
MVVPYWFKVKWLTPLLDWLKEHATYLEASQVLLNCLLIKQKSLCCDIVQWKQNKIFGYRFS